MMRSFHKNEENYQRYLHDQNNSVNARSCEKMNVFTSMAEELELLSKTLDNSQYDPGSKDEGDHHHVGGGGFQSRLGDYYDDDNSINSGSSMKAKKDKTTPRRRETHSDNEHLFDFEKRFPSRSKDASSSAAAAVPYKEVPYKEESFTSPSLMKGYSSYTAAGISPDKLIDINMYTGTTDTDKENYVSSILPGSVHTTKEETPMEPPDIKSPPFHLFSPAMTAGTSTAAPPSAASNNKNRRPHHHYKTDNFTARNSGSSTSNKDPRYRLFQSTVQQDATTSGRTATPSRSNNNNNNINNDDFPLPIRTSEWQPVLENMRSLLEEKDEKIQSLQDENDFLRAQLHKLQQQLRSVEPLDEEFGPRYCQDNKVKSPELLQYNNHVKRKTLSPHNTTEAEGATTTKRPPVFSPGTQFVADLAAMMELEVGHHAPLSFIIDKHLDRYAKYKSDNGY